MDAVNKILQMIDERTQILKQDLDEFKNENYAGYGFIVGALDELLYLRDEITEEFNLK